MSNGSCCKTELDAASHGPSIQSTEGGGGLSKAPTAKSVGQFHTWPNRVQDSRPNISRGPLEPLLAQEGKTRQEFPKPTNVSIS